ncbi:DUF4224 domain-containing protein [Caballeronia sp. S22]|uniref:DUF4224 domain-containing protein n=1 Tax=Caballeronia sp. S22 TaxID=3137182 RepID=UPI003530B188
MENRLMTPEELKEITGLSRHSKQAEWFRTTFGIDIVRSSDGRPVVTWALYEALLARRAGLTPAANPSPPERPKVYPLNRDRKK